MALDSIIRSGVALANRATGSLQTTVIHEAWTGQDKYGEPVYATAVERPALVERKTAAVGGSAITQNASVTLIGPIASNGAEDRQEPIDNRDRITLPDGWTAPIVNVSGLIDPSTGQPYMYTIALGNPGGPA